jgi:hypothetical protein
VDGGTVGAETTDGFATGGIGAVFEEGSGEGSAGVAACGGSVAVSVFVAGSDDGVVFACSGFSGSLRGSGCGILDVSISSKYRFRLALHNAMNVSTSSLDATTFIVFLCSSSSTPSHLA